ncbi:MAG TPA: hypothetical protein PKH77_09120 [Anaerolineae bacterium]|nr:hypothetical protein [Anaerolineae bacterium]
MENKPAATLYHSYLLRLWAVSGTQTWRVMVEHIGTHERRGFASLEEFFDFLRQQTSEEAQSPEDTTAGYLNGLNGCNG